MNVKQRGLCTMDECDRPHFAYGYCTMHWKRWRKHGDPSVVLPARRPRVGISYRKAHRRLVTDKGSPKTFACVVCGDQAAEWAYIHGCPDEQTEILQGLALPFCPHAEHYEPRCISCHRRADSRNRRSTNGVHYE